MPKVKVTVVSVQGHCGAGHTPGQSWVVDRLTPEGICTVGFACLEPTLRLLRWGGAQPWQEDKDTAHQACSSPNNRVLFQLTRLPD